MNHLGVNINRRIVYRNNVSGHGNHWNVYDKVLTGIQTSLGIVNRPWSDACSAHTLITCLHILAHRVSVNVS